MRTPEQLKGAIRSMAAKKNLRAQEVLQMFLFERVLERLANSDYKENFILKGGLLISSTVSYTHLDVYKRQPFPVRWLFPVLCRPRTRPVR